MCPSSGSAWAVRTRGCELLGPGPMRIRVGTCERATLPSASCHTILRGPLTTARCMGSLRMVSQLAE